MHHIHDKNAIVTGASSGIGAATVKALLNHNVNVVAVAQNIERLNGFVEPLKQAGHNISGYAASVEDL